MDRQSVRASERSQCSFLKGNSLFSFWKRLKESKQEPKPEPTALEAEGIPWPERLRQLDLVLGFTDFSAPITAREIERLLVELCSPLLPSGFTNPPFSVVSLEGCSNIFGSFSTWEETFRYRIDWCERAPDIWLDPLLEVCRNQPSLQEWGPRIREEWPQELARLVGHWGRAKPAAWPSIFALAEDKTLRLLVLWAAGVAGSAAALPLVTQFLDELPNLSDDEILWLLNAVGLVDDPETCSRIARISPFIRPDMEEALESLAKFSELRGCGYSRETQQRPF